MITVWLPCLTRYQHHTSSANLPSPPLIILAPNNEEDCTATWKRKGQQEQQPHFGTVADWLNHCNLGKHEMAFIKHGFDNIDFVGEDIINDADLATMGINDPQDKHDLMEALKRKGYSQGNITNHSVLQRRLGMYSRDPAGIDLPS